MSILHFRAVRPDKNSDRVRWNESWEQDLDMTYKDMCRGVPPISLSPESRRYMELLGQHNFLGHERESREVCSLQNDLAEFALQQISTDDFDNKWKTLTYARRRELVLEALWRASSAGPDMEDRRKWCPELTVKYLAGNHGQGFLDLLLQHLSDELRGTKVPKLIPHVAVERLLSVEPLCMVASETRLHRAYCITMTLWRILLAFYDRDEDYVVGKPFRESSKSSYKVAREATRVLTGDNAKETKRALKELKGRDVSEQVPVCWNCGKDAKQLKSGQELKVCQGCKKIGRVILYCSRECQADDWKNKTATPHKSICGKTVQGSSIESEPIPESQIDERIPAADKSFKRPPALLHQISFLRRPPYVDYVLVLPSPKDDIGITIPFADGRIFFLSMRQRALRNGDKGAVCAMFMFLILFARRSDVDTSELKKQLEKEYGARIDPDNQDLEMPTEDEIEEAKKIMALGDR